MKTRINFPRIKSQLIRNTLIAVTAMSLPVLASASQSNISVSFNKSELQSTQGQERVYQQMKTASRKLCGTSNVHLTGSVEESVSNDECYDGTLTAAVQRLDNKAITALHAEL